MPRDDDPGWPSPSISLAMLVPGLMARRVREAGDGLVALRRVTISFTNALVLFGVVLTFAAPGGGAAMPWVVVPVAVALVGAVIRRQVERPLDCSSETALAASYRTRYFVRLAFADAVALSGFVAAFAGGPRWVYYAAGAFTLYRIWAHVAPTRSALEREQAELRRCRYSLVAALRGPARHDAS